MHIQIHIIIFCCAAYNHTHNTNHKIVLFANFLLPAFLSTEDVQCLIYWYSFRNRYLQSYELSWISTLQQTWTIRLNTTEPNTDSYSHNIQLSSRTTRSYIIPLLPRGLACASPLTSSYIHLEPSSPHWRNVCLFLILYSLLRRHLVSSNVW